MKFEKLPDGRGLLYVPERKAREGSPANCPDCLCCQQCSTDRCNLCRRGSAAGCRSGSQGCKATEEPEP